jgi:hypothetical protein
MLLDVVKQNDDAIAHGLISTKSNPSKLTSKGRNFVTSE